MLALRIGDLLHCRGLARQLPPCRRLVHHVRRGHLHHGDGVVVGVRLPRAGHGGAASARLRGIPGLLLRSRQERARGGRRQRAGPAQVSGGRGAGGEPRHPSSKAAHDALHGSDDAGYHQRPARRTGGREDAQRQLLGSGAGPTGHPFPNLRQPHRRRDAARKLLHLHLGLSCSGHWRPAASGFCWRHRGLHLPAPAHASSVGNVGKSGCRQAGAVASRGVDGAYAADAADAHSRGASAPGARPELPQEQGLPRRLPRRLGGGLD
mmetsp:Transcript_76374/g.205381  ORF Transcript_76374/g.205381 Transcript_76374/m.205381 type:complete len:265 (-) Transcript_76374:463-1257(-)